MFWMFLCNKIIGNAELCNVLSTELNLFKIFNVENIPDRKLTTSWVFNLRPDLFLPSNLHLFWHENCLLLKQNVFLKYLQTFTHMLVKSSLLPSLILKFFVKEKVRTYILSASTKEMCIYVCSIVYLKQLLDIWYLQPLEMSVVIAKV